MWVLKSVKCTQIAVKTKMLTILMSNETVIIPKLVLLTICILYDLGHHLLQFYCHSNVREFREWKQYLYHGFPRYTLNLCGSSKTEYQFSRNISSWQALKPSNVFSHVLLPQSWAFWAKNVSISKTGGGGREGGGVEAPPHHPVHLWLLIHHT